MLNILYMAY